MWEALITLLVGAILIFFIVLILKPVSPEEKRKDDRDAKKSADVDEPGGWTRETQQPAELQVGEKREKVVLSRFEPDPRR